VSVLQVLDGLAVVVAASLVGLALLVLRRRLITRRGGTFDCSLRLHEGSHGKGWALGIGRYSGEALEWYRVFSYSTRPRRVVGRRQLKILDRREPRGAEAFALLAGAVIVRCHDGARPVEFAMSSDALTGFLSWAESAPPGMPVP
jgi:hypothetical protein